MARPGVTYSEVAAAANQIIGQGKAPTIEQIRILLGTGSSTTIANHLREWKQQQENTTLIASKENLPQELVSILKGLWERVNHIADEKITSLEASHQEAVAYLDQELQKYKNNNQRWQAMFNQWSLEKAQMEEDKKALNEALLSAQKQQSLLQTQQEGLTQQLKEKHGHVEELRQLHKQAQTNLEHYRESSREQRLIEQEQFEKQKQELRWELKNVSEQSILIREKYTSLQQEFQSLQNQLATLSTEIKKTTHNLELSEKNLAHSQKECHTYQKELQLLQSQFKEAKQILETNTKQFIELNSENKLMTQQLVDVNTKLKDLSEINKLLSHEKWIISQEKAQLEGQLKQLDRIKGQK